MVQTPDDEYAQNVALEGAIKAAAWDDTRIEVHELVEEVRELRRDLRIRRLTGILIFICIVLAVTVLMMGYYLGVSKPLSDRVKELERGDGGKATPSVTTTTTTSGRGGTTAIQPTTTIRRIPGGRSETASETSPTQPQQPQQQPPTTSPGTTAPSSTQPSTQVCTTNPATQSRTCITN